MTVRDRFGCQLIWGARESCEVRVATICGLVMQCAANCQLLLPYLGMLWRIRRAAGLESKLDAQL